MSLLSMIGFKPKARVVAEVFRIGDRVQIKERNPMGSIIEPGDLGTVTHCYGHGVYDVRTDLFRAEGTPFTWGLMGENLTKAL